MDSILLITVIFLTSLLVSSVFNRGYILVCYSALVSNVKAAFIRDGGLFIQGNGDSYIDNELTHAGRNIKYSGKHIHTFCYGTEFSQFINHKQNTLNIAA